MSDNAPTNVITGYPFFAPQAILWVAEAVSSVSASALLTDTTQQSTPNQLTAVVKNASVTPGTRDFDVINVFGQAVSGGQVLDRKKASLTEASFTLINLSSLVAATSTGSTNLQYMLDGAGAAISTTGFRTTGGDKTSSDRTSKSFLLKKLHSGGTHFETVFLNNAWVTGCERSLDADGHEEATITVKCLVSDLYHEYNKIT